MLKFTVVSDNLEFIGASDNHSILVNRIMLVGASTHYIESGIRGSLVCDSAAHSDYIELEFNGNNEQWENVNQLVLLSDDLQIATLSINPINKSADDTCRYRFTAEFEYTEKLLFESVRATVPYATNYGDGLVKFYSSSVGELEKSNTVYTASDVDGIIGSLSDNYVTLDTEQSITGVKSFVNNNVYLKNPSSDQHYIDFSISGDPSLGKTCAACLTIADLANTNGVWSSSSLYSANQANGLGTYTLLSTRQVKLNDEGDYEFDRDIISKHYIGNHYNTVAYDSYVSFEDLNDANGPWHDYATDRAFNDPAYSYETSGTYTYSARLRLRKTESYGDDNVENLSYKGIHTYADIYADHTTIASNDVKFSFTSSDLLSVETVLTISPELGVHSEKFSGGYVIDDVYYPFGTAGSYTAVHDISDNTPQQTMPTTQAVKDYVSGLITSASSDILNILSSLNEIGSIGLFLYSEIGAAKQIGSEVVGIYLQPVGMSLSYSGQILYTAQELEIPLTGVWKLMSFAMARTVDTQCLVLAQKISEDV
jgi:hypothetical protein